MGNIRNMQTGSTGPDVKAIQQALNLINDNGTPLKEDGIWGPKTDKAVRQYQADHNLTADGIVGPKTRASLFPLGVATVTVFGQAAGSTSYQLKTPWPAMGNGTGFGSRFNLLRPGDLTLRSDLNTTVRSGLGSGIFTPKLFPALTLPLYAPRVPDFNFQIPPLPGQAPAAPFGFVYDHLEVQPGGQSTFPLGGLRQDAFFLTMQSVFVRGDPDDKHAEADFGVTIGSPFTGLLANGTPWTFNPFIQYTDVDRFGKLGMFHYWQPYAQVGIQGQGPGAPNLALTASLFPVNLGLDIGDNLTIAFGGGLAASIDLKTGAVMAGPQANFGLTLKLGQAPKP